MIVKYKKELQSSLSYFPSMIKRRPCQILFLPLVKRECHLENTNYYLPFLASKKVAVGLTKGHSIRRDQ